MARRVTTIHPSWIPIVPLLSWWITLWVLLGVWLHDGRPIYPTMEGTIAYISDIGATNLKPLFIVGCIITGLGFFATLVVDALLRRAGILERTGRKRSKWLAYASVVAAFIGALGLVLLSGFDTARYPKLHDAFLAVFIIGVIFSALFTIIEYYFLLRAPHINSRLLRYSFYGKIVVFIVELGLAIGFGVCLRSEGLYNTGAILEWVVAFVFEFYLFTFYLDLHPANEIIESERAGDGMNVSMVGGARRGALPV